MTKLYSRRDSATDALRRLGIDKSRYNNFIEKQDDGQFKVFITKAKKSVKLSMKADLPKREEPKQEAVKSVKHDEAKETVSGFIRQQIMLGLDNAKIFLLAQKKFGLSEDKKSYPAWYRGDLKRKGLI